MKLRLEPAVSNQMLVWLEVGTFTVLSLVAVSVPVSFQI